MTLPELRAELIRQQADVLALDQQLQTTAPGTKQYEELRNRRQQLGLAITATKQRLGAAQKGRQSSLL